MPHILDRFATESFQNFRLLKSADIEPIKKILVKRCLLETEHAERMKYRAHRAQFKPPPVNTDDSDTKKSESKENVRQNEPEPLPRLGEKQERISRTLAEQEQERRKFEKDIVFRHISEAEKRNESQDGSGNSSVVSY